jgi:hydrogenase maturation protease
MTKVAVIGIGQSLRGDDAVGLEAVRLWREKFPETASRPEVRIEACELSGLALLDLLQDVNAAILVDAIQGQSDPGTIHLLDEKQLSAFTSDAKSAHGWGIAETLQLGHELMLIKTRIKVIGIQVEQMTMGLGLSKAVKDAVPIVCNTIQEETNKLLCE